MFFLQGILSENHEKMVRKLEPGNKINFNGILTTYCDDKLNYEIKNKHCVQIDSFNIL